MDTIKLAPLIQKLRLIKSENEIKILRKISEISALGYAHVSFILTQSFSNVY
mgnify:CR=1 FL=1